MKLLGDGAVMAVMAVMAMVLSMVMHVCDVLVFVMLVRQRCLQCFGALML